MIFEADDSFDSHDGESALPKQLSQSLLYFKLGMEKACPFDENRSDFAAMVLYFGSSYVQEWLFVEEPFFWEKMGEIFKIIADNYEEWYRSMVH